jgi:hypothetical protein
MRIRLGNYLNRILTGFCLLLLVATSSGVETPNGLRLKSAFLCNFTKFVNWPAGTFTDPTQAVTICTLGKNTLGGTLETAVTGMRTEDRPFLMRALESEREVKGCQVLFIPGTALAEYNNFLSDLSLTGLLTVSESDGGATPTPCGIVITFVSDSKRVRFAINQAAAGKAGLTISSKLLNLAVNVEKEQPCQHQLEPEQ